jgi:hypothetical protein
VEGGGFPCHARRRGRTSLLSCVKDWTERGGRESIAPLVPRDGRGAANSAADDPGDFWPSVSSQDDEDDDVFATAGLLRLALLPGIGSIPVLVVVVGAMGPVGLVETFPPSTQPDEPAPSPPLLWF